MRSFWNYFEKVVGILPFAFVFIASLYIPTDPDLGWHLKYGEYFFQHGQILRDNIFSTTMPDFKWANGQWGTDVITYAAFRSGGFFGLTLAAAAIVTLTFYFFAKAAKFQLVDKALLFPLFVYLESPINSVSLRGQQISLLMTGLMCLVLSRYKPSQSYDPKSFDGAGGTQNSKVLYWLPVLFLLWANIHEQFLLGLAILGAWMGITIIRNFFVNKKAKKIVSKEAVHLICIFFLSFAATFVNPFGAGVHLDALLHLGNPLLQNVAEYLPFTLLSQLWWTQVVIGILVVFSIIFIYFNGRLKDSLPIMGAAFILFVLSFEVRRYAWTAYYLIIPILVQLAVFLAPSSRRNRLYFSLVLIFLSISVVIFLKWPLSTYKSVTWEVYCNSNNTMCSPPSAEYLSRHKLTENLLSLYGWGGWLIWNYPDIKPSIDGRMHLWEKDEYSGFVEYYKYEQNVADIDKSTYSVVYMSPSKPIYKRMEELVESGKWKKTYEDNRAGIFVRILDKSD